MWEYTKYYLAPLTQALALLGFYVGGNYTWIGVAFLPAMAVIDSLLPLDLRPRKMKNGALAFVPIWLSTLLGPCVYLAFAWSLVHHDLSVSQIVGGVMSCAWLSVVPGVSAFHELYHARGRIGRTVARYAQVCYLDPTLSLIHISEPTRRS